MEDRAAMQEQELQKLQEKLEEAAGQLQLEKKRAEEAEQKLEEAAFQTPHPHFHTRSTTSNFHTPHSSLSPATSFVAEELRSQLAGPLEQEQESVQSVTLCALRLKLLDLDERIGGVEEAEMRSRKIFEGLLDHLQGEVKSKEVAVDLEEGATQVLAGGLEVGRMELVENLEKEVKELQEKLEEAAGNLQELTGWQARALTAETALEEVEAILSKQTKTAVDETHQVKI
jgi:hypothetical protein